MFWLFFFGAFTIGVALVGYGMSRIEEAQDAALER